MHPRERGTNRTDTALSESRHHAPQGDSIANAAQASVTVIPEPLADTETDSMSGTRGSPSDASPL
ncbi:hypothetical protein GCM10009782_43240 [Glycomyces algeriensis]